MINIKEQAIATFHKSIRNNSSERQDVEQERYKIQGHRAYPQERRYGQGLQKSAINGKSRKILIWNIPNRKIHLSTCPTGYRMGYRILEGIKAGHLIKKDTEKNTTWSADNLNKLEQYRQALNKR
jgi:hypothetical protein